MSHIVCMAAISFIRKIHVGQKNTCVTDEKFTTTLILRVQLINQIISVVINAHLSVCFKGALLSTKS